jgi:hypothetical protein
MIQCRNLPLIISFFIENSSKILPSTTLLEAIKSETSRLLSLARCLDHSYLKKRDRGEITTVICRFRSEENMDSQTLMIVAITVVICALIGVGAWIALDRARSRRLREHFGPEYDHVLQRMQNRNLAEAELQSREERVKKFRIVPLSSQDRAHYRETWVAVQNRFVDDPQGAVKEGHGQIFEVMEKRGYPVTNFEQAAADLSVEYPDVVENYRGASAIAARNRKGEASTEELRQALVHYRALFNELLEGSQPSIEKAKPLQSRSRPRFQFRGFRKGSRGGLRS